MATDDYICRRRRANPGNDSNGRTEFCCPYPWRTALVASLSRQSCLAESVTVLTLLPVLELASWVDVETTPQLGCVTKDSFVRNGSITWISLTRLRSRWSYAALDSDIEESIWLAVNGLEAQVNDHGSRHITPTWSAGGRRSWNTPDRRSGQGVSGFWTPLRARISTAHITGSMSRNQ